MDKFLLLASAGTSASVAPLADALADEGRRLVAGLAPASDGSAARITAVPDLRPGDPAAAGFARVLDQGLSNGVRLGGFEVVLDVDVPIGALPRLTAPLAPRQKVSGGNC